MSNTKQMQNGITEGVIWKQLLIFFFPILLGTFFQQLYNTVDAMVVGRYVGKEALAAVGGATSVVINLFVNLFTGIASGATVVVSQYYGARDPENLQKAVHTAMAISLVGGAAIMVVGFFGSRWSLVLMGTPADILDYSTTYMQVYFLGSIASFVYNMGSAILRAVGDTRRPLYFLIAACLTNIVLDLAFVVVFNWGVFGVAVATVTSQVVSAVLVVLALRQKDAVYHLDFKQIRFHRRQVKGILLVGLPSGLQADMYNVANLLIQSSVNSFGTNAVAAWSAYGKLDGFFWMVTSAYCISLTTFVGQNFGAQKFDRIHKSAKVCTLMHMGTAVVFSLLFWFAGRPLLSLFTTDPEVLDLGLLILRVITPTYIVTTFGEILPGAIRGAGEALPSMLLVCGGACGFRITWILVVLPLYRRLETVLVSFPISWALISVLFLIYYLRGNWLRRQIKKLGLAPS